ncbi:plasmid pRiA4b ORF-3 family protein [Leisingera aquaemixtae]|uniref:Plasmid pRiA4b ORF-3-like protein n=1 Tax=Leisingera aquaemixtae TaxID=1396826 RepID=A0A0P1H8W3_9RHOB|nr:plasmid pRiA4b ORF-3 family protein [Leisingera aquaemixtae]CUH99340.1 Plasmid pRiA4b ORF-3-like protein [Leisingera aquaemixtae]
MADQIARLRVELLHIEPRIWRRVEVSLTTNLSALHELIQAVMSWENDHLYQFSIGERFYGEPGPEDAVLGHKAYHAKYMRLGTLVGRGIAEFQYTYDFGDNWQHSIAIEHIGVADPDVDYPIYLDGERTAPPEDVGGPPGIMDFLEAMANNHHPEHKNMIRWYGRPFNPIDFSASEVAATVRDIAAKRKVARLAFERSRQER